MSMNRRASLRASDADRERVAERLRTAAAEGRLTHLEFEERLARALRASTYGDLDPLVADLPGEAEPTRPLRRRSGTLLAARRNPGLAVFVALMAAWMIPTLFAMVVAAVAIAATAMLTVLAFIPLALLLLSRGGARHRRSSYTHLHTHARRSGRF
jgi:hypothetical protein